VREDPGLQRLQAGSRLETQLVGEVAARALVDLERLALSPAPVQRQHDLFGQLLAGRMGGDERLQLGHELGVAATLQVGLDATFDCGEAQLLEAPDLGARPVLVAQVGQRRSAP